MIRKIEEVLAQLQEVGIDQYGYEILSLWGKEIVNECRDKAETRTETWYNGEGGSENYEVIDEQSILKVKDQIK